MKFDINNYKGNYAMHCKTEEEAKDFCNHLHKIGRRWITGDSYVKMTNYEEYKGNTIYYFNKGTYGSIRINPLFNSTAIILEWSDFMSNDFTKADLKDGMVVEYRNGSRRMVMGNKVIGNISYSSLNEYNNALETQNGDATIDKVYKSTSCCLDDYFKPGNLTLVWERKEPVEMTLAEVCKLLGKEIKIIPEK